MEVELDGGCAADVQPALSAVASSSATSGRGEGIVRGPRGSSDGGSSERVARSRCRTEDRNGARNAPAQGGARSRQLPWVRNTRGVTLGHSGHIRSWEEGPIRHHSGMRASAGREIGGGSLDEPGPGRFTGPRSLGERVARRAIPAHLAECGESQAVAPSARFVTQGDAIGGEDRLGQASPRRSVREGRVDRLYAEEVRRGCGSHHAG